MKTLILSIISGFFTKETNETPRLYTNSIFLKNTDPNSGRTLIIEEDKYNVWVYILSIDKKEIDFDGFLCTVVSPVKSNASNEDTHKKETPFPEKYANKYSWVKDLKKESIKIEWLDNNAIVWIKDKQYLVMDVDAKTSYSRALSVDCSFGKSLENKIKK